MRTIPIDSQVLNTTQACGEKVNLEFIQNWRPTEKSEALEKGDLMHKMFAHYYQGRKEGRTGDPAMHGKLIEECVEVGRRAAAAMDLSTADSEENIKQFIDNVMFWKQDGWVIQKVEEPFSKIIYERPDEPGKEGLRILYEGIIDLVIENPSPHGIFIVDHKTSSRRGTPSTLSNQFMGYSWAMNNPQLIVNKVGFQKTIPMQERFQRQFLQFDREVLKEWVKNTIYWTHVLVGYIDQGFFPKNFTSCDKYSGCIFKGICAANPGVREFKLQAHFYQGKPWSPHTRDKEEIVDAS